MTAVSSGIYPDVTISKRMKKNLHEAGGSDRAVQTAIANKLAEEEKNKDNLKLGRLGDTVHISAEGRALQQKLSAQAGEGKEGKDPGSALSAMVGADGGGQAQSVDPKEVIAEQIREVKKQLQKARARLAQAEGNASASQPSSSGAEGDEEAAAEALSAFRDSPEVESIRAEINMLNQRLQILNQELVKALESSGSGAVLGTAGIGGVATGPSGQGERIPVRA